MHLLIRTVGILIIQLLTITHWFYLDSFTTVLIKSPIALSLLQPSCQAAEGPRSAKSAFSVSFSFFFPVIAHEQEMKWAHKRIRGCCERHWHQTPLQSLHECVTAVHAAAIDAVQPSGCSQSPGLSSPTLPFPSAAYWWCQGKTCQ